MRSSWSTTAAGTRPGPCCRICAARCPTLAPVQNPGPHGFGRAVVHGLNHSKGDACVIMMADASDSPEDAVRYWRLLNEGWECVFGSRFIEGGRVIDYPRVKLFINRLANLFIKVLFHIPLNDTTNAFKAYRRNVLDGCRPFLSPHFNLTVEIPLKAIVRGLSVDGDPHHLAEPPARRGQAEDQGDGQPVFLHLHVRLAGKILQPRRLPPP